MNETLRVLVVDDEKSVRRFLRASLSSNGYTVFEAVNGREALDSVVSAHPDVIILDLGLPDMDGVQVAKRIRQKSKTPIVILSVRESEEDKVAALDAGADDYLTKPFGEDELLARLRAVMRRFVSPESDEPFMVGHLKVDLSKRLVQVKGNSIELTPTEYDIVKILVLHAGRVVTHKQIYSEIWATTEDQEGISHLLRVTISNLRYKLEPNPQKPSYILTEPAVGYRLRAEE